MPGACSHGRGLLVEVHPPAIPPGDAGRTHVDESEEGVIGYL